MPLPAITPICLPGPLSSGPGRDSVPSRGLQSPHAAPHRLDRYPLPSVRSDVDFWQKALGYVPREPASGGWSILRDPGGKYPNVSFQARETQRPGRNWIHLDLYTDNQTTEVARLEALGARRYPWRYRVGADFVVLEDPDGNLFCVVQQRKHWSQAATDQ